MTNDKLSNTRTRPFCLFMVQYFLCKMKNVLFSFCLSRIGGILLVAVSEMKAERLWEILAVFILLLQIWKQVSAVEIPPDGESVSTDYLCSLSLSAYLYTLLYENDYDYTVHVC